ncbi:tc3 transposase domain-containing protein [Ditylenchus destructor]|nr:tc3 transposase domain-containing protein [Ditylenchus destructor]
MPRGTPLSPFERGQIAALKTEGKGINEISRMMERSSKVIRNYLKDPAGYGTHKTGGPKPKLTPRDKRALYKAASNKQLFTNFAESAMATTTFYCDECDMSFDDEMGVRKHMSEMHNSYFPYKCFTCKKNRVNHETESAEQMYQHTSTVHEGIEPDVRYSIELKVAIQNRRRPSAEQNSLNYSKIPANRVLISENMSTLTEMNPGASEFEVNANSSNMLRTDEWLARNIQPDNGSTRQDDPNLGLDLQNVRLFTTGENELADIRNCRLLSAEQVSEDDSKHAISQGFISVRDTLTNSGDDAIENVIISTEIKQECNNVEVHESTNNDNIGTTNEGITHSIQPESGSARGDESNSNEILQENIEALHNSAMAGRAPKKKQCSYKQFGCERMSHRLEWMEMKKVKKTKDPNAPKHGRTAYILWLMDSRSRITKPGLSVTDVAKAAAVEWNALKDKTKWEKAAAEDKERYWKESAVYDKKKLAPSCSELYESD